MITTSHNLGTCTKPCNRSYAGHSYRTSYQPRTTTKFRPLNFVLRNFVPPTGETHSYEVRSPAWVVGGSQLRTLRCDADHTLHLPQHKDTFNAR